MQYFIKHTVCHRLRLRFTRASSNWFWLEFKQFILKLWNQQLFFNSVSDSDSKNLKPDVSFKSFYLWSQIETWKFQFDISSIYKWLTILSWDMVISSSNPKLLPSNTLILPSPIAHQSLGVSSSELWLLSVKDNKHSLTCKLCSAM